METTRPWQVIADEMTEERDPERMLALAEELNRALAEQQDQKDADGAGQFLIKSCKQCGSDELKNFNGELAIHFPGLGGLDKPIVWVFPKLRVCLACGLGEFVVPDDPLEQLRKGGAYTQLRGSAGVVTI